MPLSIRSLIGYFHSRDLCHNPCVFVNVPQNWCSNCKAVKVTQSIRGKGGHIYLPINMKNANLDFEYFLSLCQVSFKSIHFQWLHRSKSCVQIRNKCDDLCWTWILENMKWFQSLNKAWLHMYIHLRSHAQSGLWPLKKTIIKIWA